MRRECQPWRFADGIADNLRALLDAIPVMPGIKNQFGCCAVTDSEHLFGKRSPGAFSWRFDIGEPQCVHAAADQPVLMRYLHVLGRKAKVEIGLADEETWPGRRFGRLALLRQNWNRGECGQNAECPGGEYLSSNH
jgi:hypothetical protein